MLGYLHGLFPALMEETTFRPLPNSLLFSALCLYLLLESFFPSDSHLMRLEMILTVSQPHQFIFPYKYFQFSVKEHTLRYGVNLIYPPKVMILSLFLSWQGCFGGMEPWSVRRCTEGFWDSPHGSSHYFRIHCGVRRPYHISLLSCSVLLVLTHRSTHNPRSSDNPPSFSSVSSFGLW